MQRLKKIIPRSLYGRFLMIVVLSGLIVQLVSIYVFYYAHLDVISKHMARSVISEMVFVKTSINKPAYKGLLNELTKNTGLEFSFEGRRRLKTKKIADSNWRRSKFFEYINPIIDPYNRFKSELESYGLKPYEIFDNENSDLITVKVQTPQGILSFDVPIKKITSSSGYVFTFWMLFTTLSTSVISIIFFRNQIRLLANLTNLAEKFGRGQNVPNIRPAGSQEIRSLTISFIKMKERVMRQIKQRTDMLSAVSHDLRTPLTRIKLQLAMMNESEEINDLKSDIADMEKLVNEYLDFARFGDNKEKVVLVKFKKFLDEKFILYYQKMNRMIDCKIDISDDFEVSLKKLAFKRALGNLIENAFNHGEKVFLSATVSNNNLIIEIEDDGPGIPANERENVFKPFYRLDNARNLDKKNISIGSGLGMAIALDAISSHGGRIKLGDSRFGGLLVSIFIPL